MESHTTVSQLTPQNSKKRVFPGGSSSSSGCKEVEVLEIAPTINRTPKTTSSKQKQVIYHEIIDVDMEEDCDDIMLIEGEVGKSAKGKAALSSLSNGVSNIANNESGSGIQTSNNGAMDDFSPELLSVDDEWIDTYYDDIIFDDYATMESHFDHMDFPPGVETPFPWLPSSSGYDTNVPTTSTPTNSSSQLQTAGVNLYTGLSSSDSSYSLKPVQIKELSASQGNSMISTRVGSYHPKGKLSSKWLGPDPSQKKLASSSSSFTVSHPPTGSLNHKHAKEPLNSFGKSKRKPRASHVYSSSHNQLYPPHNQSHPPGALIPATPISLSNYPTLNLAQSAFGMGYYMPMWDDLANKMLDPSVGSTGFTNETAFGSGANGPASNQNGASPIGTSASTTVEQKDVNEILQKFSHFKRFDTVENFSDHHYSKKGSSAKQPPKSWAKRIQEEWKILEKDLPDTIFVRVYESRMDLLRAVIVGAEGTPYHDGLFFFDVYFPTSYPNVPPHVHYHSGGLRINPNLYNCGKVCLSLLNTWSGSHKEKWIPGVSTMLQVLVSIQGLILNAKPYFNEPGYANLGGSVRGEKSSLDYNERIFIFSLQTMVYNMRRPPKYFEDFVVGYFCKRARDILISCKAYLDGAQVGCLVTGGVQDVDEGDKSSSQHFRHNLARFITTLVNTFSQIGAKDCQEFLSLAQKANAPDTATGVRQMTMQFAT